MDRHGGRAESQSVRFLAHRVQRLVDRQLRVVATAQWLRERHVRLAECDWLASGRRAHRRRLAAHLGDPRGHAVQVVGGRGGRELLGGQLQEAVRTRGNARLPRRRRRARGLREDERSMARTHRRREELHSPHHTSLLRADRRVVHHVHTVAARIAGAFRKTHHSANRNMHKYIERTNSDL